MKICRVFVKEYSGNPVGKIFDCFAADKHPGTLLADVIKECEVADDFDAEVMTATVAEDGSVSFAADVEKQNTKEYAQKKSQIEVKYREMDEDILTEMIEVFGTSRADSATAFHETFKLMVEKPALFATQGLLADKAAGGFIVGQALNSTQKIQDYANARIALIEAFAVFRMNRIAQFQQEKAAIMVG